MTNRCDLLASDQAMVVYGDKNFFFFFVGTVAKGIRAMMHPSNLHRGQHLATELGKFEFFVGS